MLLTAALAAAPLPALAADVEPPQNVIDNNPAPARGFILTLPPPVATAPAPKPLPAPIPDSSVPALSRPSEQQPSFLDFRQDWSNRPDVGRDR